ncbi:MAG: DUF805 domain-containing protein [Pseudomonadota bacterium]|nr:DUF805 domain-containing protein [Pseudomonadota bacterium]
MRGEVLHYDEAHGFGFITGADGNRYTFRGEDVARSVPLARGVVVEFLESGDRARDISRPVADASGAAPTAVPLRPSAPRHFGRNAVDGERAETGLWSYFRDAVTINYANFRTRARRKEYWGFVLFSILALIALSLVGMAIDLTLGNMQPGDEFPVATLGILGLAVLAGIVPSVAMAVRRQHDIGLSGWFYLVFLVPSVGYLILLVFALIPSQKRVNKWGPVPAGIRVQPSHAG